MEMNIKIRFLYENIHPRICIPDAFLDHHVWASHQIRQIAICACTGKTFSRHQLQRKQLVSDPGIHYGTCVSHMPWCMSGSLTCSGGENVRGIPGACATRTLAYVVRSPWCWSHEFTKPSSHFRTKLGNWHKFCVNERSKTHISTYI